MRPAGELADDFPQLVNITGNCLIGIVIGFVQNVPIPIAVEVDGELVQNPLSSLLDDLDAMPM